MFFLMAIILFGVAGLLYLMVTVTSRWREDMEVTRRVFDLCISEIHGLMQVCNAVKTKLPAVLKIWAAAAERSLELNLLTLILAVGGGFMVNIEPALLLAAIPLVCNPSPSYSSTPRVV